MKKPGIRKARMKKDDGAALLTAVIAVSVLALMASVFFALSASRGRMEDSEEKGMKAYYLAESGIQFGLAQVLDHAGAIVADPATAPVPPPDPPFGADYGGTVSIKYSTDNSSPPKVLTIQSTGTYRNVIRTREIAINLPQPPDLLIFTPTTLQNAIIYEKEIPPSEVD